MRGGGGLIIGILRYVYVLIPYLLSSLRVLTIQKEVSKIYLIVFIKKEFV